MLDKQDLQAIADLLDKKLEEKFDEFGVMINESFSDVYKRLDSIDVRLDKFDVEMKKRPTYNDFNKWADENVINLQLRVDRLDYLHMDELKNLPSSFEIGKSLSDSGLKKVKV